MALSEQITSKKAQNEAIKKREQEEELKAELKIIKDMEEIAKRERMENEKIREREELELEVQ